MSLSHKALYKWPIKLRRVSSPLKLKKASYSHWWVEEVEVIGVYIRAEDWEGQRCDKMRIIRDEWTHEKKKKKITSFIWLEVEGGGCVAESISRRRHHLAKRWRPRTITPKSTMIFMLFWNSKCSNPMSFLFDFWTNIFKVKAYKDKQMTCAYPTPNPNKNVFLGTSVVK